MKGLQKETDLKELCDVAIKSGATRAVAFNVESIVVDERVQLKCRYPPCPYYGKNLMCPPYTPTAKEFREYMGKYKHAVLVQMDVPIMEEIKKRIKSEETKLAELVKDESLKQAEKEYTKEWTKLHAIVSAVEREAFNKGYRLSLGLVVGNCRLCDTCDPRMPCKKPYEARPSMEAMSIDVHQTAKNVGLELKWGTKETMTLNGLILID
jgi:predicted metal-binding protein